MNAHDSEKVVGTLWAQGYTQVATPDDAELVFYNTCSIRDKAEQKVFHRLQQFKKNRQGQDLRRAGLRRAAGRRRRFSKKRPMSAWCAARPATTSCRSFWCSSKPATGASPGSSLDTDDDLRHAAHAPRQSASRLYHHHRRLRQIVRLLRGAVHARSGAQPHQRIGDGRSATSWLSDGFTEIQLLGQNVNSYRDPSPAGWDFATLLDRGRPRPGNPARALHHLASARFRARDRRRDRPAIPALCNHVHLPVQSGSSRVLDSDAAAVHPRRIHAPHRVDEETRAVPSPSPPTSSSDFRARPEADFEATLALIDEVGLRFDLQLQILAPPQHARAVAGRSDSGRGKGHGAWRFCRNASAPFRSAATPPTSEPWKNAWWKDSIKRRASGSDAPRRTRR